MLGLVLGAAIGSGCASSFSDSGGDLAILPLGTGGATTSFVDGGRLTGGQAGGGPLNPLCGHVFGCSNPDNVQECSKGPGKVDAGYKGAGGSSAGGAFGSGGVVFPGGSGGNAGDSGKGEAGVHPDGSADGQDAADASDATSREGGSHSDASLDSGAEDHAVPGLDSGTIAAGGSGNSGPDGTAPPGTDAGARYSCQVALPPNSGTGGASGSEPFMQCLSAGDGKSYSPCRSSADCLPGLACAADLAKAKQGACLPYCCDSTTSCEKAWLAGGGGPEFGSNLICGKRSLVDGSQKPTLTIPVCVPADRCKLSESYPCTGSLCSCPDGTACTVTVVPGDGGNPVPGTTYCAVPGKGRANEACSATQPCAAGYFCSESRGVCLKMCKTDGVGTTCAPGHCQQAAGFPDNWGVCVGAVPAAR